MELLDEIPGEIFGGLSREASGGILRGSSGRQKNLGGLCQNLKKTRVLGENFE